MKRFITLTLVACLFALMLAVKPASAAYACGAECVCPGVGTPGYWKNHPEAWPLLEIDLDLDTIVDFTQEQALYWMNQPVSEDKSITMFKAIIAARLNWEMGCHDPDAQRWYWEGVSWLERFPVGSGIKGNTEAWQYSHGELIYWWLDQFNNGYLTCPPRE